MSNIFLSQFLKLRCAIDEIYKFEKDNSIYFQNFLKMRTDFFFLNSENLLNMTRRE